MRLLNLLLIGLILPFVAQTQDTTSIKFGKRKIVIIESENENIEVEILEDSTGIDTAVIQKIELGNDEDIEEIELEEIKKYPTYQNKDIAHWAGIDFGVNGFFYDNQITENSFSKPENSLQEIDLARSGFLQVNFLEQKLSFFGGYAGIITGLGISFRTFEFRGNTTIQANADSTWFTESSGEFRRNNLNIGYLKVPLILELNSSLREDKTFHFAAGVEGGLRFGSTTNQVFDRNITRVDIRSRGHFNLNPFQLDAVARIGYKNFVLFGQYGLMPFFENDKGPQMYTYTCGLRILGF